MASTEDIEAKLAAYVDGELDPADHAEIEAHLASNPEHRRLIEELMRQRELLRGLPRVPAPAEIAETVHAQLERALLLGDADEPQEAVALRISRWPQIRAIAAVLVLTAGLAAAVYYMLPSQTPGTELAILHSADKPVADDNLADASVADAKKGGDTSEPVAMKAAEAAPVERLGKGEFVRRESEQEIRAKSALAAIQPRHDKGVASNVAPPGEQMFREIVTDQMKATPRGGQLYVVVSSRNPSQSSGEVRAFLENNKINWQPAPEPMPPPLELSQTQVAAGARFQQTRVGISNEPARQPLADGYAMQTRSAGAAAIDQAGAAAGTTQPMQQALQYAAAELGDARAHGHYILARQMTRRQAAELSQTLNVDPSQQIALVVEAAQVDREQSARAESAPATAPAEHDTAKAPTAAQPTAQAIADSRIAQEQPAPAGPTTSPGDRPIEVGDIVTVVIPQLAVPGIEATTTQQIGPDGAVTLPMLDPLPVLGLRADQVRSTVADKYRDARLVADADVTVTVEAAATAQKQQAGLEPARQAFGVAPATQSTADELLDVLIVVQNESPIEQPASQPATAPTHQSEP